MCQPCMGQGASADFLETIDVEQEYGTWEVQATPWFIHGPAVCWKGPVDESGP
jgi:hypothetical protein